MKTQIPIYRAKKIDSDKYLIGTHIEVWYDDSEEADETDNAGKIKHCIIKDFQTMHDDFEECTFTIEEIDPSTLAIHFPDMIDSKGTKIFASLSEDGKGGDKFTLAGHNPVAIFTSDRGVRLLNDGNPLGFIFEEFRKSKVTGIQE